MERSWLKYPLLLFALGVILKLVVHLYGLQYQGLDYLSKLALPLFLILSVFLAMWEERSLQKGFIDKVKTGMKAGMVFAVLISGFSYVYYGTLDPDYFKMRNERLVRALKKEKEKAGKDPEKRDPMPDKSVKEYRKDLRSSTTPFRVSTLNMLFFTFLSILASLMIGTVEWLLLKRGKARN
ncbi:MAG: DUF4199 domain-containing protein [Flavobacteriales bacterium]